VPDPLARFQPLIRGTAVLAASLVLTAGAGRTAAAQDAEAFFRQNCISCHTIGGGRITGPDLKDVLNRKDRSWLTHFITNPKAVIDAGDPYAVQLQQEARAVVMPTLTGMTPAMADALLALIAAESKLPKSRFAGAQISDRPFTAVDVQQGRDIFFGARRLAGGGAPCLSCHGVSGARALGGGKLGPDLTKVYERLQGRKGLAAWLAAPATPTMQAVFRTSPFPPEEILPLVAFFERAAKDPVRDTSRAPIVFLALGLGGAAVGLVVLDGMWKQRFRAVRRPLVRGDGGGGR
jgi:mono/diheme cytochrome c family protein